MAETVHLDESNEASEVETHAVTSLAMGTADASGMTPGAAGARQTASSESMQKALRLHLTDLGGVTGLTALRVYCDPSASGWTLFTNAIDEPSQYAASQVTVYEAPEDTTTRVPHPLPEADPLGANLGIGGDLAGQLIAPGQSDYCYIQLRADGTVTEGFTSEFYIAYDVIG